jgi:hypothetical protein
VRPLVRHVETGEIQMARRPRLVDPTAGPIEAFAHDLRELREKAGNPTYRTLARKAGYSPSTLSEAACGQRLPSLSVTLAYVGACGGDLDEWRVRWHDLAATKANSSAQATGPTGPTDPIDPAPPGQSASQRSHPRRQVRSSLPVVALGVTVVVAAVIVLTRPGAPADQRGQSGCPSVDASAGAFTGRTYTFSRVRNAARLSAPVMRNVPGGCTLVFTGYCLGDIVTDRTARTPDIRWFILASGGVMASAVVHGNPPSALTPSSCPGDSPPPAAIRLRADRIGDELRLRAGGEDIKIVGFTALRVGGSDGPTWRQISLTAPPTSIFEARWRPPRAPKPAKGQNITVAAVACLGGDGPTTVIDARTIEPGDLQLAAHATLSGAALDAATRSACQYP